MSDELCPGCPGDPNETCCKPELRVKVWMDKQKADMSEQKAEQKPEHEKRIRALLDYHANSECELVAADKTDLRALLADLDAVRGALEETLLFCETFSNRWDGQTGAHPFEMVERARAALKGATA